MTKARLYATHESAEKCNSYTIAIRYHLSVYVCHTNNIAFHTFVLITVVILVLNINLEKNCVIDFFIVWIEIMLHNFYIPRNFSAHMIMLRNF